MACLAVFSVLTLLHHWDFYMRNRTNSVDLYIELDSCVPFGEFLSNARELDLELSDIQKEENAHYDSVLFAFIVTIRSQTVRNQEQILNIVRRMEGVKYLEIL